MMPYIIILKSESFINLLKPFWRSEAKICRGPGHNVPPSLNRVDDRVRKYRMYCCFLGMSPCFPPKFCYFLIGYHFSFASTAISEFWLFFQYSSYSRSNTVCIDFVWALDFPVVLVSYTSDISRYFCSFFQGHVSLSFKYAVAGILNDKMSKVGPNTFHCFTCAHQVDFYTI